MRHFSIPAIALATLWLAGCGGGTSGPVEAISAATSGQTATARQPIQLVAGNAVPQQLMGAASSLNAQAVNSATASSPSSPSSASSQATAPNALTCRTAAPDFRSVLFSPGQISPTDGTCLISNQWITTEDGVRLIAHVVLPAQAARDRQPVPLVVMPTSWAVPSFEYLGGALRLARQGYAVLTYVPRGFYRSGGQVMIASPQDVRDLSTGIDWVQARMSVQPGAIAAAGISYGAGLSLLALAHDPRIRTAVAMDGWADLEDELYPQYTANAAWLDFLTLSGLITGRPDPIMLAQRKVVLSPDPTPVVEAELRAWARQRSPARVIDAINARQAPVLFSKAWQDDMFTPNSSMAMFEQLKGPKKMLLNQGIHASSNLPAMMLGLDGFVSRQVSDWLDYWLLGKTDNGALQDGQMSMEIKFAGGRRDSFNSWPSARVSLATHQLAAGGQLLPATTGSAPVPASATMTESFNNGRDTVATSGLPIVGQLLESINLLPGLAFPVRAQLASVDRNYGMVWETGAAVTELQRIRGIATLNLPVRSSSSRITLFAYLYDVDAIGSARLITHAPVTRYRVTPGQLQSLQVPLKAVAYDLPAGHRLALAIDTVDPLFKGAPDLQSARYTVDYAAGVAQLQMPLAQP